MKTIIIFFFALLIIFNSCDKKDRYYPYESWTMEIMNSSGTTVNIQFFSDSQPSINIDTTLLNNNYFILSRGDNDPVGGELDLISRLAFDSSVIRFTDNKQLIYTFDRITGTFNDSARNILFKSNYILLESKDNKSKYRYEIIESDYQKTE